MDNDHPFNDHDNGYLMANGSYKTELSCNDMVRIYYEDGSETMTTYIGHIYLYGIRYNWEYISIPLYSVCLPRNECVYYSGIWLGALRMFQHVHGYIESKKPKEERRYMIDTENDSDETIIPIFDLSGIDLSKKPRYSYNGIEIAMYQYGNLLDTMTRLDNNLYSELYCDKPYTHNYKEYILYDISENYIGRYEYTYSVRTKVLDCKIRFVYKNGDEILDELNSKKYDYYLDMHLKPPTKEYTIEDAYNSFRDMVIRDQQRD